MTEPHGHNSKASLHVSEITLGSISKLEHEYNTLTDTLMKLELRKVQILRAAQSKIAEKEALWQSIILECGLPPGSMVEIDPDTGQVLVLSQPEVA